jgi:multiple sugar transport system ATP-binding protein
MGSLGISVVSLNYGNYRALKCIDLAIDEGEFLVLLGPSGCGKSSLLNVIAGLERPNSGLLTIDDRDITRLQPKDRNIAMVFQSYALYPSMTVRGNIEFGLRTRGVSKARTAELVANAAELLQITKVLDRKPSQLSGGQRQRVAIGRAIVREPALFLFDEPLSNLDAKLRVEMRTELKLLHERLNATIVYVTHDQIEAMTLATKIAVMRDGELQQVGSPNEIYNNPANTFVAGFIGSPPMNLVPCRLADENGTLMVNVDNPMIGNTAIPLKMRSGQKTLRADSKVLLGVRPEDFSHKPEREEGGDYVPVKIVPKTVEPTGPDDLVIFDWNNIELVVRTRPGVYEKGKKAQLFVDRGRFLFFDPETEQCLE